MTPALLLLLVAGQLGTSSVNVNNWPATQPVSGNITLNLWDGGVDILNWPGSMAVTGTFWQATQPVSGSVSVSNLPTTQPVSGSISVSNFPNTQPVSGSVSVSNLPATQPVSGSVSVSNFPVTQPVSGTFWQATQPVSGSVSSSDSQSGNWSMLMVFDGGPIPVSGTFYQATQPISGSVSVSNFPGSQAVTGTFWQATQPVSGTFWQATQPVSGTVTATVGSGTVQGINAQASGSVEKPIIIGGIAVQHGSAVTQTANGQTTQATMTLIGRQMVDIRHPNHFSCNVTDLVEHQCVARPSTLTTYVTDITVSSFDAGFYFSITEGTGTNGCDAGTSTIFGPVWVQPLATYSQSFLTAITAGSTQAICCSATQPYMCHVEAYEE